jgi:hypothetical protein
MAAFVAMFDPIPATVAASLPPPIALAALAATPPTEELIPELTEPIKPLLDRLSATLL